MYQALVWATTRFSEDKKNKLKPEPLMKCELMSGRVVTLWVIDHDDSHKTLTCQTDDTRELFILNPEAVVMFSILSGREKK